MLDRPWDIGAVGASGLPVWDAAGLKGEDGVGRLAEVGRGGVERDGCKVDRVALNDICKRLGTVSN